MDDTLTPSRAVGLLIGASVLTIIIFNLMHPIVDPTTYQSVYLSINQQYFGKLHGLGTTRTYLTDIYYLSQQDNRLPISQQQDFNLVKLGSELHGPEDVMFIDPHDIVFWHNLKKDSQVVQTITRGKNQTVQPSLSTIQPPEPPTKR